MEQTFIIKLTDNGTSRTLHWESISSNYNFDIKKILKIKEFIAYERKRNL